MNISDPLVKITDLNAESGNVCIDGEILGMEDKETKTGKVILSINIYDGTSTMTCKKYCKKIRKNKSSKISRKSTNGCFFKRINNNGKYNS